MPDGAKLNAAGQHMRRCLAENGIELTPDQLVEAILTATERLQAENPSGFCGWVEWLEALTTAVLERATPEGREALRHG